MTQPVVPSQVAHPWRAVVRTVAGAALAVLPILPTIADQLGIVTVPAVASVLVVAGGVTRVLAIPAVNAWLTEFMPWLGATPRQP